MRRRVLALALVAACGRKPAPPPELTVLGESTRLRMEGPRPAQTAWFDGTRVSLVAARGETLGIQVALRDAAPVTLTLKAADGVAVAAFDVESFKVSRPSTAMYGGSQGRGTYPDPLRASVTPGTSSTNPAYFEIVVGREVPAGTYQGELVAGPRHVPVVLEVSRVTLPPLAVGVWALYNPREIALLTDPSGKPPAELMPAEDACIDLFRAHGVMLSPDLHPEQWEAHKPKLAGLRDIPVWIPSEPDAGAAAVREWIAKTAGTGMLPFSIPIDEPRTVDKQDKLKALAVAVRAAGGGPDTFRLAVTDDINAERYGDLIDLYLSLYAKRSDPVPRWTYNGAPPHAGAPLLDAESPGARTWGWIAWRWNIPLWYAWDALYWHDRHNRKGAPLPGKQLVPATDPVSFDDGTDRGNFDGVLTLPAPGGCTRMLRLAAIRRGLQDKALLELAATCDRSATDALAGRMVPRALGDAPKGSKRSWSADESDWERARRELLTIAVRCAQ